MQGLQCYDTLTAVLISTVLSESFLYASSQAVLGRPLIAPDLVLSSSSLPSNKHRLYSSMSHSACSELQMALQYMQCGQLLHEQQTDHMCLITTADQM